MLVGVLLFVLVGGPNSKIEPVEALTWSRKRLVIGLLGRLGVGLLFGLLFGLVMGLAGGLSRKHTTAALS